MTDALPPDHWLRTAPLYRPSDIRAKPCPVPASRGIYAWFFRDLFPGIEFADRLLRGKDRDGHTLLYVGISPSSDRGKSTIRKRLLTHCGRDAYWSTLRRSLGALLRDDLSLTPVWTPGRPRPTFGDGELRLSEWMDANARVAWHEHDRPWEPEDELIAMLDLPLNLRGNERHAFYRQLQEARTALRVAPTATAQLRSARSERR